MESKNEKPLIETIWISDQWIQGILRITTSRQHCVNTTLPAFPTLSINLHYRIPFHNVVTPKENSKDSVDSFYSQFISFGFYNFMKLKLRYLQGRNKQSFRP